MKRKLTDPEEGLGIPANNIRLYGQDVNPEAYAVCCAEMLMLDAMLASSHSAATALASCVGGLLLEAN